MTVPSSASAVWIQTRWNLRRMLRSRTLLLAAFFAAMPIAFIFILNNTGHTASWQESFVWVVLLAGVLGPLFMASAMAEEIEDKTFTYLWSRPLSRWTVVVSKLLATAPIVVVFLIATIAITLPMSEEVPANAQSLAMLAAVFGATAVCMVSGGFALLMPKAGMAATYAYLLALDLPIGAIPFSLRKISVTFQFRSIAEADGASALVTAIAWLMAIGLLWLGIGLMRLRRAEFASSEK